MGNKSRGELDTNTGQRVGVGCFVAPVFIKKTVLMEQKAGEFIIHVIRPSKGRITPSAMKRMLKQVKVNEDKKGSIKVNAGSQSFEVGGKKPSFFGKIAARVFSRGVKRGQ